MLNVGVMAPGFELKDQSGTVRALADSRGSWVVLYFYPKDDTAGCTKEACGFRDALPDFEDLGAVVYGVSADDEDSHTAFADKYSLTFPLLVDSDMSVINRYEAYGDKVVNDEVRQGILRLTYLIDPSGRIARTWQVTDPEAHAVEVKSAIEELSAALT
jgi:peroxiredoxin Q/BCP